MMEFIKKSRVKLTRFLYQLILILQFDIRLQINTAVLHSLLVSRLLQFINTIIFFKMHLSKNRCYHQFIFSYTINKFNKLHTTIDTYTFFSVEMLLKMEKLVSRK